MSKISRVAIIAVFERSFRYSEVYPSFFRSIFRSFFEVFQCSRKKVKNINYNSKLIVQELSIDDRVEKMLETEAYITIKDHREAFPHKLSFHLLNPCKSDIGKIGKNILDRINKSLISSTHANQWKNTSSVIGWFKNISNKRQSSFIQFDVENFYPSISLIYLI